MTYFRITKSALDATFQSWFNGETGKRFGEFVCDRFGFRDEDIYFEDSMYKAYNVILHRYGMMDDMVRAA